ncbi:MAG: redoxin domain-containing protein [Bacteroidota bacterium]
MKSFIYLVLIVLSIQVGFSQSVKNFTLTNAVTNQEVSLSDFSDKKAIAIVFTSNICPYSVYYEGRITQLVSEYSSQGIQFLLINSHLEGKESVEEMANKISTWGMDVPYLADKDQKVLNQFGARKSPEAYLLRKGGNGFSVFYKGAIDNNPQVANDVKQPYLKMNIEALLNGGSPTKGSRPIGCSIKKL